MAEQEKTVVKLSPDKTKLFKTIMKSFRLALKNSVFYQPDHPIFAYSINNLKSALDKWMAKNDKINIGFSNENLFLNGDVFEKDAMALEVASYLHTRGIISIQFLPGLDAEELKQFLTFMRLDRITIRNKGGIKKNLPEERHIHIMEIDYGKMLKTSGGKSKTKDDETWESLIRIANEAQDGELPESKANFLIDFFTNTETSAETLNKVYQESIETAQDEETIEKLRESIQKICEYFEEKSDKEAKEVKIKLMRVVSQLHPDLVNILFDETVGGETNFDLIDAITKDFSESYIAEFIEKLISSEDTFNENLLKVFDKLAPNSQKSDNMMNIVADRLFSKRIVNPETLTKLQMSIKEIFNRHPESNFMNQLYKITVDAVTNHKIDTLIYVARLSPLINKFVQSIEEGELKKEELWLLLNILWLENDVDDFNKFSKKVFDIMPELLSSKETKRVKEIVEFFSEKTRPEQRQNKEMVQEIRSALNQVTNQTTIHNMLAQIPGCSPDELNDIAFVLYKSDKRSAKLIVDAFLKEKNPATRYKYRLLFKKLKKSISKEAIDRLSYCEPYLAHDLFLVLASSSPKKAHLVAKKMIHHTNTQMRYEAFRVFSPRSVQEVNDVLHVYRSEKHEGVKKRAAAVVLKTKHPSMISKLFQYSERNIFKRKFLIHLIELSGILRSRESFPHLKRLFLKRPIFYTRFRKQLRITAVNSLARLKTKPAMKLVHTGLQDKDVEIRKASEILMQLHHNK